MKSFMHIAKPAKERSGKQKEDLHGSGVYPTSGPLPKGEAPVRTPAEWNEHKVQTPASIDPVTASKVERARKGAEREFKAELDEAYSRGNR